MDKKTYFFIFLALVAGTLAGYTSSTLAPTIPHEAEKQETPGITARPRFGGTRSSASTANSRQVARSHAGKSEMAKLDDTLKQYARMSAEELWTELEALNKQEHRYLYSPNTTRETLISYIITRLGQDAPRQTLAQMKNNKRLEQYQYSVLETWGGKNPEAAQAYCRENMEGDPKNSGRWKSAYIGLLLNSSPDKAIDYLLTLPPKERSGYSQNILFRIAGQSPEKMTELMKKLTPVATRNSWTDNYIAAQWAKYDWNATEQWIKTLPEEKRGMIMGQALASLPQEEAQEKIKTLDEKGKLQALIQLSNSLSWESPVKALEMLQKNTTEEQAVKVLDQSFYSFNARDNEVNSYLNNMPAGAVKDCLLEKAINSSVFGGSNARFFDPKMEDAFSLINQISSAGKKEKAIDSTLNQWMHNEPQKVKSWVEQSQLPDDKKKRFTTKCNSIIESRKKDEQS